MGKFSLKGDMKKMKTVARSTKDLTQSSSLKRKEAETTIPKKSSQLKKSKSSQEALRIKSSKQSMLSSIIVDSVANKGKGKVEVAEGVVASSSHPIKLAQFLVKVTKAFSRSIMEKTKLGDPNIEQKLRFFFNQLAMVS